MGKGISSDNGFIGLNRESSDVRHQFGTGHNLPRIDRGMTWEYILTCRHRHHHLLESGIACPLAEPIDGALDLTCAIDHGR